MAEGTQCHPGCRSCSTDLLYTGDPNVGRVAANLARILRLGMDIQPCQPCQGRGCGQCYGNGSVNSSCPNPAILYLRALRAWWPRGFWGWLTLNQDMNSINTFHWVATHHLPGWQVYQVPHVNYNSPSNLGYLTGPVVPEGISTMKPGRLLGVRCPELPEVPSCFCVHIDGDCPLCSGEGPPDCSACQGDSYCLRCDPRSPIRFQLTVQDGFAYPQWTTAIRSALRRAKKVLEGEQSRPFAPNPSPHTPHPHPPP
jgi:hypothetical protein